MANTDYCKPICDFIELLKKENLLTKLEECREFKKLHIYSSHKKISKENNPSEYYIPILEKILGQYACNTYYNPDTSDYEFSFPKSDKPITVHEKNINHLFQPIRTRFVGKSKPQAETHDKIKLIALAFYEWCHINDINEQLAEAFSIYEDNVNDAIYALYRKLLDPRSLAEAATDKTYTAINLSPMDLLFGDLKLKNDKLNVNIRKYLNNRNIVLSDLDNPNSPRTDSDIYEELKEVAKQIMEEAFKYPTYRYLQAKKDPTELRELLKISASYNLGNISVVLPIEAIIKRITTWYNSERREYTLYTMFDIVGELAATASTNSNHLIDVAKLTAEVSLVNTIYNDLSTGSVKWITNHKFTIRQYRLVFLGIGHALKYNRLRTAPEQIISDINKNFKKYIDEPEQIIKSSDKASDENTKESTNNHTTWSYDYILCFTCAMMCRLDDSIRIPLIEMLCAIADDFSPANRKWQVISIYILTYLLCEKCDMPQELRTKVFIATYGHNMYKLQHDSWQLIEASSSFYTAYARNSFEEACVLIDNEYAAKQPDFFFLYGYLNEIDFEKFSRLYTGNYSVDSEYADMLLKHTAWAQAQSWFLGNTGQEANLIEHLNALSDHLYKRLTATPDANIMKYVYAALYFCFAISNLFNRKIINDIYNIASPNTLLAITIHADYYNRRHNAVYNNLRYLKLSNYMFLINAPIRVLCSNCFSAKSPVILNEEQQKYYTHWIYFETGRYKFLLHRLLSYTNFWANLSEDIQIALTNTFKNTFKETEFLPYDNMPETNEELDEFLRNPRLLFRHE